jgi:hypothetical protein
MSNFRNTLAAGVFAAMSVLPATGCDSNECRVVSKNGDSPELSSIDEICTYCDANKSQVLSCLAVESGEETDDCYQKTFSCNSASLVVDINAFFAGNGEYCVQSPATLDFDF